MNKIYDVGNHNWLPVDKMSDCCAKKAQYVEKSLNHLIKEVNCGYARCVYLQDADTKEEFVKVIYPKSHDGYYVNVSADSLLSLSREVLKSID